MGEGGDGGGCHDSSMFMLHHLVLVVGFFLVWVVYAKCFYLFVALLQCIPIIEFSNFFPLVYC